jgi:hypothetical protein
VYQVKRDGEIFDPEDIYLVQSTLYFREIVKIKKAFEKAGVDFVFLKGLPLHLYFEKTYPRRFYADCDLLINKQQLSIVDKVMKSNGYEKDDTVLLPTQKLFRSDKTELNYFKLVNNFYISFDIHLEPVFLMVQFNNLNALYPRRKIDALTQEFLSTKREVKILENSFPILAPENATLYLALHFFHGNYKEIDRLPLLFSVTKRLNNHDIAQLAKTIKEYSLENFTYQSFIIFQKYYPSSLPKKFLVSIKPQPEKIQTRIMSLMQTRNSSRISNGIQRFRNIYYLSPQPGWKKVQVFFDVQILVTILWLLCWRLTKNVPRLQSNKISKL